MNAMSCLKIDVEWKGAQNIAVVFRHRSNTADTKYFAIYRHGSNVL